MAKRYFWLKLKEDFFDEDTIQWLEEQKNGKEYCLFYLKMCLKSLKTDGVLIRRVGQLLIPYEFNGLAKMTNTHIDTVVVAMKLFEEVGLIEFLKNGEIYLTKMGQMVGSETDKAQIMRKKREVEKLGGNNVTKLLPNCYTETEQDQDQDKEQQQDNNNVDVLCKKCNLKLNDVDKYLEKYG